MRPFFLHLLVIVSCISVSAQSNDYERQAKSHQSNAAYYVKQAQGYDRDSEYYMREVANYLKDAEYYQRQKQFEQAWSSLRKARNAIERADENKRKADIARSNAKSYYLKADENACLSKRGARWLLHYHRNINMLPLQEKDIQRLQIIAGVNMIYEEESEVPDTIIVE